MPMWLWSWVAMPEGIRVVKWVLEAKIENTAN